MTGYVQVLQTRMGMFPKIVEYVAKNPFKIERGEVAQISKFLNNLKIGLIMFNKHPCKRVEAPEAVCSRYMAQPFDEMVAAHIKTIWASSKQNHDDAWQYQNLCVNAFIKGLTIL